MKSQEDERPTGPGWNTDDERALEESYIFRDMSPDPWDARFRFFSESELTPRPLERLSPDDSKFQELEALYQATVALIATELVAIPKEILAVILSYQALPFAPLRLGQYADITRPDTKVTKMKAQEDFCGTEIRTSVAPERVQDAVFNLYFDPSKRYANCRVEDVRLAPDGVELQYKVAIPRFVPEHCSYDCGTVWVKEHRLAMPFHIFPKRYRVKITSMNWRKGVLPLFYANPRDTSCFLGDGYVQLAGAERQRKLVRELREGDVLLSGAHIARVDKEIFPVPKSMSVVCVNGFHLTSGHPILVQVPQDTALEIPAHMRPAVKHGKQWVHPWEVMTPFHTPVTALYHFELAYLTAPPDQAAAKAMPPLHTLEVNGTICAALGCDVGERLQALHPADDARWGTGYWK